MNGFFEELKEQRWDDHRFYHHSRVNQTLHLVSAMSFCATYVLLFTHPVFAVLFGWTFAMCIRQVGHFFFEPKGYDEENQATHEYKESVKVGYNLRRKVILHSIWGAGPAGAVLLADDARDLQAALDQRHDLRRAPGAALAGSGGRARWCSAPCTSSSCAA